VAYSLTTRYETAGYVTKKMPYHNSDLARKTFVSVEGAGRAFGKIRNLQNEHDPAEAAKGPIVDITLQSEVAG
jgi:hypothetical protein